MKVEVLSDDSDYRHRVDIPRIVQVYNNTVNIFSTELELFTGSVIGILKFVSESDLVTKEEKQMYYKIMTAQLSPEERTLIFYYMALEDEENLNRANLISLEKETYFFLLHAGGKLLHNSHSHLPFWW